MRKIKVAFVDFPGPVNVEGIVSLLRQRYEVMIDDHAPDYVFYSVFGYRHLDYPCAIRIFFTGENVIPDFNLCDYAFGFAWLSLEDRYFRCPNFCLYSEFRSLQREPLPLGCHGAVEVGKRRFCNFLYSNGRAHPFRDELFYSLCEYKKVDSAGPHLNNTGMLRGNPSLGVDATQDKIAFLSECKFSIAVENSSAPGYVTEKLVHAILADTIPIYWGDPEVCRHFNPRRFINCHDFAATDSVVKRVAEIDNDDVLYESILNEPMFPGGEIPPALREETVLSHLAYIFDQPLGECRRRNPYVWGTMYEVRRKAEVEAYQRQVRSPTARVRRAVLRLLSRRNREMLRVG